MIPPFRKQRHPGAQWAFRLWPGTAAASGGGGPEAVKGVEEEEDEEDHEGDEGQGEPGVVGALGEGEEVAEAPACRHELPTTAPVKAKPTATFREESTQAVREGR